MNGTGHEWQDWFTSVDFRAKVEAAVQRHTAADRISPDDYLLQKRAELTRDLNGKALIYLDTKHWVNLSDSFAGSRQDPLYEEILSLLQLLRQKGRICCPVSATLFSELMKQRDPLSRQRTAGIMDLLSGGVCLRNWLQLAQAEFARHVCRTLEIQHLDDELYPTWTKIGYWAGEHTFRFSEEYEINGDALEKVYIDLRWQMTCKEYQSMPKWTPPPDSLFTAWIAGAEQAKAHQAQARMSLQKLTRSRRRLLLEALKDTLLPMLALCQSAPGTPDDHVVKVLDPIYEGRDPLALPSLEVVAGLDAAVTMDTTRKIQVNDIEDFTHAAQALPYCDALFCDNFMAQKLQNKQLNFGNIYQTNIGSRAEEIIVFLKSML